MGAEVSDELRLLKSQIDALQEDVDTVIWERQAIGYNIQELTDQMSALDENSKTRTRQVDDQAKLISGQQQDMAKLGMLWFKMHAFHFVNI